MQTNKTSEAAQCVIYARVSLEEQTERFGLSSQLSELRAHAKKQKYEILREFIEEGYSGGDLGRPALNALRELIRAKVAPIVLVHDPDRLARRLAHQLLLTDEIERAGARLEFVTTPAADNMEGRLLLNIRGVIAEYEREKIRERTMRGRREKARQGLIVGGRRTYGYQPAEGVYQIDPDEADVVRSIFKWLAEDGLSIRKIIEQLNAEGYRPHSSQRWAKSSVSRILRNETYIGRTFYNRRQRVEPEVPSSGFRRNKKTRHLWRSETEWIPQSVPALIPVELFQAAQLKLKQNSAHCSGRPAKTVYLLRGILKCPVCGRKYAGVPIFGDRYYRCSGRERLAQPRCSAPVIAAKTIEPFVWQYMVRLLSNPDLLAAKLVEQGKNDPDLERELARVDKQIQEIRKKESRLLDALLDEEIALPSLRSKAKELESDRLKAQQKYEEIQARLAAHRDQSQLRETVLRYCRVLGSSVENLDLAARQKLLRALLDDVIIEGGQVSLRGILPTALRFDNRPQRVDDRPARFRKNYAG